MCNTLTPFLILQVGIGLEKYHKTGYVQNFVINFGGSSPVLSEQNFVNIYILKYPYNYAESFLS